MYSLAVSLDIQTSRLLEDVYAEEEEYVDDFTTQLQPVNGTCGDSSGSDEGRR